MFGGSLIVTNSTTTKGKSLKKDSTLVVSSAFVPKKKVTLTSTSIRGKQYLQIDTRNIYFIIAHFLNLNQTNTRIRRHL